MSVRELEQDMARALVIDFYLEAHGWAVFHEDRSVSLTEDGKAIADRMIELAPELAVELTSEGGYWTVMCAGIMKAMAAQWGTENLDECLARLQRGELVLLPHG